uniref:Uncharacterized protein n=1 Tax=Manihot esculenta TaxID=3983 RepID=A0A2C9U364_MANES
MQARMLGWDIIRSIIAVGAEAISAALEQTSPHKAIAARYGVIMAIVSVLLTFADLAFKKYMLIRDKNTRPNNKYHKLSNGKQQPIQFSMIPVAFSVCVFCSRHLGFINLDIESVGILFDNDEPMQFGCPVYQIKQIHPQGV